MTADAAGDRVRALVELAIATDQPPELVCAATPDLLDAVRERVARVRAVDRRVAAVFASPAAGGPLPRVPGFAIEAMLGSGGMGAAYRARRDGDGAPVALKLVHAHLVGVPGFRERFVREAEIGRRVTHDNVVRTLDVGEFDDAGQRRPYLVLEHVQGQTLRGLAAELGRVPDELLRHVARAVACGLAAIHDVGAVHRDVKPDNVLITEDHVVKVMDLGAARRRGAEDDLSAADSFVGSVRYAAPEQLRGRGAEIDGRTDLHALGVMLFELATGRHPFAGDDLAAVVRAILEDRPRRAAACDARISPFLDEVIARLLEKSPDARFSDARALAAVLERGERSAWWAERAQAARPAAHRALRRFRAPGETPLRGRAGDVARLSSHFSAARAGEGRVVLVEGEAGVGKSRLVDEFADLLERAGHDVDVLVGGYAPGGAATAMGAFAAAFGARFGDDGAEIRLCEHLGSAAGLAPAFAALLRGAAPPAGVAPLTKDTLQTAFVRTVQSLALARPVLLVIEDLHLAPDEGRALFAALALSAAADRVLLVGTARRSLDETWAAEIARLPHASRMALARLTRDDVTSLLEDALGSPATAASLAPLVFEKSDGNPYFVFEILRDLRECSLLARTDDGSWVATRLIEHLRSPSSIRDLIHARIGKLAPEDREILEVAACCGFAFDPLLVAAVLGRPPLLVLRRLCALEASRRLVRPAGRGYVFDHHQVQEAIRDGLSPPHREHTHAAIASALEASSPGDDAGARRVELAHHRFEAAQPERALLHLDAARDHLRRLGLVGASTRLAATALAVPGLLAGRRRAEVLLDRAGCVSFLGGDPGEEIRLLDEATALADADGDSVLRARTFMARGDCRWRSSETEEALREVTRALGLFREAGDAAGEAAAAVLLGKLAHHLGRTDAARAHCEEGLAIAQRHGVRRVEVTALGALSVIAYHASHLEDGRSLGERALAISREIGDVLLETAATGRLGDTYMCLGRYEEARLLHERGIELARASGSRRNEAAALSGAALDCHGLGRLGEARQRMLGALALLREVGDRRGEALNVANLGSILLCLGDLDGTVEAGTRALDLCRRIGLRLGEPTPLLVLGTAHFERGDLDEASAVLAEALAVCRSLGYAEGAAHATLQSAAIEIERGRVAEGVRGFDEALAIARARALRATLVVASAERARATREGADEAADLLAEHGAVLHVESRARALLRLHQATGQEAHLTEAARLLDFMVAHTPPEGRDQVVARVRVHREIAAAARR